MTDIIPVPAPADISIYPALGSSNFNAEAYEFGTKMRPAAVRISEIAENAFNNATASQERALASSEKADEARAMAVEAQNARDAVWSAANFKGLWTSLSGALNMPATVKHKDRFWLLTRDVAIVQNEEPGESDAWTADASAVITQEAIVSLTMQSGIRYVVKTPGITLTVPISVLDGDTFSVMDATDGGFSVAWSGHTVKGQIPVSPMPVPKLRGFSITYYGGTFA